MQAGAEDVAGDEDPQALVPIDMASPAPEVREVSGAENPQPPMAEAGATDRPSDALRFPRMPERQKPICIAEVRVVLVELYDELHDLGPNATDEEILLAHWRFAQQIWNVFGLTGGVSTMIALNRLCLTRPC